MKRSQSQTLGPNFQIPLRLSIWFSQGLVWVKTLYETDLKGRFELLSGSVCFLVKGIPVVQEWMVSRVLSGFDSSPAVVINIPSVQLGAPETADGDTPFDRG